VNTVTDKVVRHSQAYLPCKNGSGDMPYYVNMAETGQLLQ